MPAVQLDGKIYLEPAEICRWLATAHEFASSGEALLPATPTDLQAMERLICAGDNVVNAGLNLVAGCGRSWGIARGQSAAQWRRFEEVCAELEAALRQHGGPYLLGQQLTLADLLVFPFLRRFHLALQSIGSAPLAGPLVTWIEAVASRPAAHLAAGDATKWLAALSRHESLDWFDYEHVGVADLHPALAAFIVADWAEK